MSRFKYKPNEPGSNILTLCDKHGFTPFLFNQSVFHYTKLESAIAILESNKLRFSSVTTFNDPFDLHLDLIDYRMSKEGMKHFVKGIQLPGNRRDRRADQRKIISGFTPMQIGNVFQDQKKDIGIFCTSKRNDSCLMWAHYTEKHKGVCFEFSFPDLFKIDPYMSFCIKYTNEIRQQKFFDVTYDENGIAMINWLFTKSDVWDYEDEVRIVNLYKPGDYAFDKKFLTGVYYGLAVTGEEKQKIEKLLVTNGYTDTKRYQMKMKKGSFDLITSRL